MKTTREALNKVGEALRDLVYNVFKSIGIIWFIKERDENEDKKRNFK